MSVVLLFFLYVGPCVALVIAALSNKVIRIKYTRYISIMYICYLKLAEKFRQVAILQEILRLGFRFLTKCPNSEKLTI